MCVSVLVFCVLVCWCFSVGVFVFVCCVLYHAQVGMRPSLLYHDVCACVCVLLFGHEQQV